MSWLRENLGIHDYTVTVHCTVPAENKIEWPAGDIDRRQVTGDSAFFAPPHILEHPSSCCLLSSKSVQNWYSHGLWLIADFLRRQYKSSTLKGFFVVHCSHKPQGIAMTHRFPISDISVICNLYQVIVNKKRQRPPKNTADHRPPVSTF